MLQVNENAKNILTPILIGLNAYENVVNLTSPATIEGAFDNALYIKISENELLRVIKYNEYVSESSIVINNQDKDFSFKSMGITEGMEVVLYEKDLMIGEKFAITGIESIEKWH
ncbi:MAG: hypothetical protein ACR2NC_01820, partial [Thermodesulfobacteriota bacterium]